MKYKNIIVMLIALFVFIYNNIGSFAAENYQLLQIDTGDGQVIAYMEGCGEIEQVECQIGMRPCKEVEVEKVIDDQISFNTIILIDNSLSITEENKVKLKDILSAYIDVKYDNEYVSIATFGEDIQFLTEMTNDKELLQTVIADGIQHNNQDTYLTDILFDLLDTLDDEIYTRFIVITDGVDNKAIGITKEELVSKLNKNSHPIYTLGHIYKSNESELENLFSLARVTNGKEFLLDNIDDISPLVTELSDVQKLIRVKAEIPNELQDGSSKKVLYTIKNGTVIDEIVANVDMPFTIMEEIPEAIEEEKTDTVVETVVVKVPVIEKAEEPIVEPVEIPEEKVSANDKNGEMTISFVAIGLIIVAVILLIVNKRKKNPIKASREKIVKNENEVIKPIVKEETVHVLKEEEGTVLFNSRYLLVLKDIKDSNRVFKYPLDNRVVIGRNTDKVNIAIDYNYTVSGIHCEIYVHNNRFYVKDLNSSNKTYLNGHLVEGEREIRVGDLIAFGEVEFRIDIIPI